MGSHNVITTRATIGRRRESRLRVRLAARLVTLECSTGAILVDISEHGARLQGLVPGMRPGSEVVLQWPGGEAFGNVMWMDEREWGMQFYDPLTPAEIRNARLIDERERLPDEREQLRQNACAFVQGRSRL